MATSQHDKLFTRALYMLQHLSTNRKVHIDELVKEFGVNRRTIYRDIERLHFFPLELNNGYISVPDGFNIEHNRLDNDELLILELAFSSIDTLDKEVLRKIDSIRAKLSNPLFFTPYKIKSTEFEQINKNSELLNKIENAIQKCNISKVIGQEQSSHVEPYKIVAFDGYWYLLAKDLEDMKIKTYMIAHIQEFYATSKVYETSQEKIAKILENVHTAWFEDGNNFEVEVKVHKEIAHFFTLKKYLPSQEILQTFEDGSLKISFRITNDEDIDNIIKAWLPHIEVLKPLHFKQRVIKELQEYIAKLS